MVGPINEANPLLKRPLYVYDLPTELLQSLTPVENHSTSSSAEESSRPDQDVTKGESAGGSTSCALCRLSFTNVQDQRQHVRSDFHKYNLKLSLKELPCVDEATFVKLIGDLDESISGSDTEDSEEDEEAQNTPGDSILSALLKKQANLHSSGVEDVGHKPGKVGPGNAPMIWLSSPKLGENIGLGVYKAILSNAELEDASSSTIDILRRKQLKPTMAKQSGGAKTIPGQQDPHFFLCMIGGGHFAAMIVSLVPEIRKGAGGVEERHAVVLAHKTFHRYTTRRKQGGSQSSNDNAKGNAHSAGSSIRRYNEMALEADVRNVLGEWRGMINTAELLFFRATGAANRRTLFGPYDGQVLHKNDPRIRGFPFSTRRATQAELLRSFQELTRLKVGKLTDTPLDTRPPEKQVAKETKPKATVPQFTKEEEAARLHTSQLQALIRRSKAPGVLLYLTKNELSADFRFWPESEHHHAPTALHLSASTNSPALVMSLLTKGKADPTVRNGDGKTAYEIAGDTKTRDAFRVARSQLGEGAFDWGATHIPSALTQVEYETKNQQEKSASEDAEAQRRKADLERLRREEEERHVGRIEKKAGPGKSLADKTGAEKREEEARGLTPELRMRLERERRARAAEERIKRMQASK
ncbi:hypothetical protein B0A52_10088 [Exophiala mesophila]|uniref:VLRF1 domain-containing protein n=1 Tax=Exophiala mesophila TaxID=212818 RepID=A0A438MRD9_EXOME|nr:hypothetical protein B0A52_10088 [Exophiala mesophila]